MAWATPKSWVSSDTIAAPEAELNRIEENTHVVYDILAFFTAIAAQTHKLDWAQTDYPTTAQAKNIDDNIHAFATLIGLTYTTRDWAGIVLADYRCWNEWEETLADAYAWANLAYDSLDYCGSFYCGEDGDIY